MANILDNILNLITSNPQLISSILSIFTNSSTPSPQPSPPPPPPPTTPSYNQDNPYWSLPNYHYNPKPKYKNIQSQYTNLSNNSTPYCSTQSPNHTSPTHSPQYNNTNPSQPNTNSNASQPQIDIQQTISVLSNLISALRSNHPPQSKPTTNSSTTQTTNSTDYIHTLHPTN